MKFIIFIFLLTIVLAVETTTVTTYWGLTYSATRTLFLLDGDVVTELIIRPTPIEGEVDEFGDPVGTGSIEVSETSVADIVSSSEVGILTSGSTSVAVRTTTSSVASTKVTSSSTVGSISLAESSSLSGSQSVPTISETESLISSIASYTNSTQIEPSSRQSSTRYSNSTVSSTQSSTRSSSQSSVQPSSQSTSQSESSQSNTSSESASGLVTNSALAIFFYLFNLVFQV